MKNLSEKLNMKYGVVSNSHVMRNVNLGLDSFDTLCLICAELNIDLSEVSDSDSDFDSASLILSGFCNAANDETGYTVSVWLD